MEINGPLQITKIVFSEAEKEFQNECLRAHNKYRALHGSPPLQLCDQLCAYASNWAKELAEIDQLLYSPTNSLGENLYMAAGIHINGASPVVAWYHEEADYDYKIARFSPYTGHFTQVVWKGTRELGVGVARTGTSFIVVASYYPPGNERDSFKANVLPPKNYNHNNNHHHGSSDSGISYLRAGLIIAAVALIGVWFILKA